MVSDSILVRDPLFISRFAYKYSSLREKKQTNIVTGLNRYKEIHNDWEKKQHKTNQKN